MIFKLAVLLSVLVLIVAVFAGRVRGGAEPDSYVPDQSSSFRPISASELWVADKLLKRKKGTLYKIFFFGLLIDAFFVLEALYTISGGTHSGSIGFPIVAVSIILLHACFVYATKKNITEIKNGSYTVMKGTVTDKYGRPCGRHTEYYFKIRDDRGVEEEYRVSHRPTYRKGEVGSPCMVFDYDSMKNNKNRDGSSSYLKTIGMEVVLM